MQNTITTLAAAAALAAGLNGNAQAAGPVSLTAASSAYTQNFNTLASSGSTQTWANGSTLAGWYLFGSNTTTARTSIVITDGSTTGGNVFSVGSAGSTDRALGLLSVSSPFSSASAQLVLALTNNTGAALDGFSLLYDSEQWRYGNATDVDNTTVSWRLGASYATSGWTDAPASFNAVSPINSGAEGALDGNAAANRSANVGGSAAIAWAPGQTLWLRWSDTAQTLKSDGLMAVDNVRFSVTPVTAPVPEPAPTALLLAGLATLGFIARRRGVR